MLGAAPRDERDAASSTAGRSGAMTRPLEAYRWDRPPPGSIAMGCASSAECESPPAGTVVRRMRLGPPAPLEVDLEDGLRLLHAEVTADAHPRVRKAMGSGRRQSRMKEGGRWRGLPGRIQPGQARWVSDAAEVVPLAGIAEGVGLDAGDPARAPSQLRLGQRAGAGEHPVVVGVEFGHDPEPTEPVDR